MPQLWMYAGAEAVKMATEDRFDITEWFKLIKDREVACKSNDEMTETKSPYQLQQIQTSRYRVDWVCRRASKAASGLERV